MNMPDKKLIEKLNNYLQNEQHPHFLEEAKKLTQEIGSENFLLRFSKDLEFGTAGMRGVIGAGSAYMNPYNIRKATQGLCNYIKTLKKNNLKAVLSYDSRHFSREFSEEAALVFSANGFETYLFKESRPTPFLSYAIRHLKADTGIMMTASHNPPKYNGYKAYWNNGGQVTPPHDKEIVKAFGEVQEIHSFSSLEEARQKGLLKEIGDELDQSYIDNLNKALPNFKNLIEKESLKIVYTPLHGVGGIMIDKVFPEKNIHLFKVEEQIKGDGNFPTVEYPNPEEPSAYKLAIKLADKVDADIIIANDPDADRIGCEVKNDKGEWTFITGNQIGDIFLDYMLKNSPNPKKSFLINSIVTSDLQEKIANHYGCSTFKTLTGFKWMAIEMDRIEKEQPDLHLALMTEESYGYLIGENVRDKDALVSTKLMAEIMLWVKSQNKTLLEYLEEIWKNIEFYQDELLSKTFEGLTGNEKREKIMSQLRENKLEKIGKFKVNSKKDYLSLQAIDHFGKITPIDPKFKTDAIEVWLENSLKFSLRPSGTEPKIKMYLSSWGSFEEKERVLQNMNELKETLKVFLQ